MDSPFTVIPSRPSVARDTSQKLVVIPILGIWVVAELFRHIQLITNICTITAKINSPNNFQFSGVQLSLAEIKIIGLMCTVVAEGGIKSQY